MPHVETAHLTAAPREEDRAVWPFPLLILYRRMLPNTIIRSHDQGRSPSTVLQLVQNLTKAQTGKLSAKVREMLGYLCRLKERMQARGFPHNDRLLQSV
jgi:hypothetical protein